MKKDQTRANNLNRYVLSGCCRLNTAISEYFISDDVAYVFSEESGLYILDITDSQLPMVIGHYPMTGLRKAYISDKHALLVKGFSGYEENEIPWEQSEYGLYIIDLSDPAYPKKLGYSSDPAYIHDVVSTDNRIFVIGAPIIKKTVGELKYGSEGLYILDASRPDKPVVAGTCQLPTGLTCLDVTGRYAFIGDRFDGITIVDVADITRPHIVGHYPTKMQVNQIRVEKGLLYVAGHVDKSVYGEMDSDTGMSFAEEINIDARLSIIDVSDLSNLKEMGICKLGDVQTHMRVSGGHAYVTDRGGWLYQIDVSNPAKPNITETVRYDHRVPRGSNNIQFFDKHLYMTAIDSLCVLSAPNDPQKIGSCREMTRAGRLHVADERAYVCSDRYRIDPRDGLLGTGLEKPEIQELYILDISSPDEPFRMGSCKLPGAPVDVVVSGDYAFAAEAPVSKTDKQNRVTTQGGGLRVVNVSDPKAPEWCGYAKTSGEAKGVFVSGKLAYVVTTHFMSYRHNHEPQSGGELHIFDISEPVKPVEIGKYHSRLSLKQVLVFQDRAYLLGDDVPIEKTDTGWIRHYQSNYSSLLIMDVSNPRKPRKIGEYKTRTMTMDVVLDGSSVILLTSGVMKTGGGSAFNYRGNLLMLDATHPSNISLKRKYMYITGGIRLSILGDYILIAEKDGSLHVIDRTNNINRGDVGFWRLDTEPTAISAKNDVIYVSTGNRLQIFQLPWN